MFRMLDQCWPIRVRRPVCQSYRIPLLLQFQVQTNTTLNSRRIHYNISFNLDIDLTAAAEINTDETSACD